MYVVIDGINCVPLMNTNILLVNMVLLKALKLVNLIVLKMAAKFLVYIRISNVIMPVSKDISIIPLY